MYESPDANLFAALYLGKDRAARACGFKAWKASGLPDEVEMLGLRAHRDTVFQSQTRG
jgi:hypothetical protein